MKKTIQIKQNVMGQNSNNGCLWALLIVLLCPWLLVMVPVLFGMIMGLMGLGMGLLGTGIGLFAIVPAMLSEFLSSGWIAVLILSILVAVLLPLLFLICAAVRLIRGNGLPRLSTWLIALLIWIISLAGVGSSIYQAVREAGGIEALKEQLATQSQVWEYEWSNEEEL